MTIPQQTPLEAWAKVPFADDGEMISAMSDPRYRSPYSSAYREAVEEKIRISQGIGTDNVRNLGVEQSVTIGTDSIPATTAAQQADEKALGAIAALPGTASAAEKAATERALAALNPNVRIRSLSDA